MNRSKKTHGKEKVLLNILKLVIFMLLSFGAIKLGMMGGDMLSDFDGRLIKNIDAEHFKRILNKSIPLINTTYNSGNISVSISGEIRGIIRNIFGFDLSMPVSILTAQSPSFFSYYQGSYQQLIAMRNIQDMDRADNFDGTGSPDDNNTPDGQNPQSAVDNEKDNETAGDGTDSSGGDKTGFIEVASSISTEEEEHEKKDLTNADKVTTGKIEILNETQNKIDSKMIDTLLKEPLSFKFDRKGPKVLIFHTHTTESFIKNMDELNSKTRPWTRDTRYNVVRVGAELAQYLEKKYDIGVIHNGTEHDYPDYNSSYKNAYKTLSSILPGNPSIKVALDIHRDAVANGKLRCVQVVDGKTCAQVMIVVAAGNPNWKENFKLAVKIQDKLNKYAPGLARPIYISKYTYNQNMTLGSLTIEIGGDGNTLAECLESTKYLAMAISEVLNNET